MPLVKANREAPTLRFTSDKAAVPRTSTTAALAAQHVPETDMEAEVGAALQGKRGRTCSFLGCREGRACSLLGCREWRACSLLGCRGGRACSLLGSCVGSDACWAAVWLWRAFS